MPGPDNMLAVVDTRGNEAWTHLPEHSNVQETEWDWKEVERRTAILSFLDPRNVWRGFLERDASHNQVHGPFFNEMERLWRNWRLWPLRVVKAKFLSCALGLEILRDAVLHEVLGADVYAGAVDEHDEDDATCAESSQMVKRTLESLPEMQWAVERQSASWAGRKYHCFGIQCPYGFPGPGSSSPRVPQWSLK